MKKKRRVGWRRVEAYTDESGHTGLKLFDTSQPWFWTGTLVSPVPVQERGETLLRKLTTFLGEETLHANRLGLEKIESIAAPLGTFLKDIDARFIFTVIEKRHLASGKLADTVLDSTMNQAVSAVHYGSYALRLLLSDAIVELVRPVDQEEFWNVYANARPDGLRSILSRLLVRLNAFRGMDKKLRELLSDVIIWGIRHPQELLEFQQNKLDAPNLVAFGLLMAGLHDILDGSGFKVGRFVHDEQQEFGKFMKEWYGIGRRCYMPTHLTAWITDIEDIDTYDCEIEILPSRGVVGLQIIDIVLWLYKRAVSDSMRRFPGCAALIELVDGRAQRQDHSRTQLAQDAERLHRDIMTQRMMHPVESERMRRGQRIVEEIERARKQLLLLDRRDDTAAE